MENENKLLSDEAVMEEELQDDRGSNNGESTASHSSEEFVKVNTEDASLGEHDGGDMPRNDDVEDIPPELDQSGKCMDKIDPRASDRMASENYLRDYYDQLPSETADFKSEDSANLSDRTEQQHEDPTFALQPEVMSAFDPFDTSPAPEVDVTYPMGGVMPMGGESGLFEPAPAASFEPEPTVTLTPTDSPSPPPYHSEEVEKEDDMIEKELESDIQTITPPVSDSDNVIMSEQTEATLASVGDQDQYPEEADLQPVVDFVQQEEVEDVTLPEDDPIPVVDMPQVKEEVGDAPAPIVEDIDTKPQVAPSFPQCPAAGDKQDVVADQDPVIDLIYWRDVPKTAAVFSFLVVILISLTFFSVISVASYAGLAFLVFAMGFRLFKLVVQTLNGTQQPHPFQVFLDTDVTLSSERAQKYTHAILCHWNCVVSSTRDVLFIANPIRSLKVGVFLWMMTYIGCCFNGLTLLISGIVLMFTAPPVYEKYQTQIDQFYTMARDKACVAISAVKAKFPGAKQEKQKSQ